MEEQAHYVVFHSGWWQWAPVAHSGKDLPGAADATECTDHHTVPLCWPQRGPMHPTKCHVQHPGLKAAQLLPVPEHHGAQGVDGEDWLHTQHHPR